RWAVIGLADGSVLRAGADGRTQLIGEHRGEVTFAGPGSRVGDAGMALTTGADGAVRGWSLEDAKPAFVFLGYLQPPLTSDPGATRFGWAVADPEARFHASDAEGAAGLHWALGLTALELAQLRGKYREPALLGKRLGLNPQPLARVDALQDLRLPREPRVSGDPGEGERRLRIEFSPPSLGPPGKYAIRVNGREVNPPETMPAGGVTDYFVDPGLIRPGENTVEVVAYDSTGQVASRGVTSRFAHTPAKPPEVRVFALVAGVSRYSADRLKLKWADQDARRFTDALRRAVLPLLGYDEKKFVYRLLTSAPEPGDPNQGAATKANILAALNQFERDTRQRDGRTDIVVVFLAGHGMTDNDGYYYFLDVATNTVAFGSDQERKAVTLSAEELKDALRKLPLNQVVVLDTCNSSAFLNPARPAQAVPGDPLDAARERARNMLREVVGSHVLMGAWNTPLAYESSRYGHGVLTYSLLRALRGYAREDRNDQGVVRVLNYAELQVKALAERIGRLQAARYEPSTDFLLGRFEPKAWIGFPSLPGLPALRRESLIRESAGSDVNRFGAKLEEILLQNEIGAERYAYFAKDDPPDAYRISGSYRVAADGRVSGQIALEHADWPTARTRQVSEADDKFPEAVYRAVMDMLPLPTVAAPPPEPSS
ncbi:MAG: caspase family protein, partial [Burkholderiales bacterium]